MISDSLFPHFQKKHSFDSLITAKKQLEYLKNQGRYPSFSPPKTLIFCYSGRFFKKILNEFPNQPCDGCFYQVHFLLDHPSVAIAEFGVGAPVAALKLEMLIAWGVKNFFSIGTAGALQPDLAVGDLILCDRAIRDEGTSHHYLPFSKYAHANPKMIDKCQNTLDAMGKKYRIGTSWTTDSFFRETKEEIKHFRSEGVLCVEMEASALFSVASLHDINLAALFTISDIHSDFDWNPSFDDERTVEGLDTLLEVALQLSK